MIDENVTRNWNPSVLQVIYFLKTRSLFFQYFLYTWMVPVTSIYKFKRNVLKKKKKRNKKVNSHLTIAFLISFVFSSFFFMTLEEVSSAWRGSITSFKILELLKTVDTSPNSLLSLCKCFFFTIQRHVFVQRRMNQTRQVTPTVFVLKSPVCWDHLYWGTLTIYKVPQYRNPCLVS